MKFAFCLLALVLPSIGSFDRASSAVDDPPPEPLDCPLCAGNASVHVARTFAIVDTGCDLVAHLLL